MSHNPQKTILCPNCGYEAVYNYCAQCGQNTHLHKETFLGLIGHFIADYFHYDSKFWKTLTTLWFKPGDLTIAYWKKQRARFIPPVSLYLFISAVFFLCYWSGIFEFKDDKVEHKAVAPTAEVTQQKKVNDSLAKRNYNKLLGGKLAEKLNKLVNEEEGSKEFEAAMDHSLPKIFFFMIPVVAFFMKILFWRRKDAYFVDHAIFSLHLHSFFFSLFLLAVINPFVAIETGLNWTLILIYAVYLVVSMRRSYKVSLGQAVLKTAVMGVGYGFIFLLATLFTGLGLMIWGHH